MTYIKTLFTSCIAVLLLTAGFNWLIDPYGMYWSTTIEGINLNKPEAGNRGRTSKPYVLSTLKPETLIVGNSRVEMGLNPASPLFTRTAYNSGIPGIGFNHQLNIALNEIEKNSNLKHIILSLDYLDFLYSSTELTTNEQALHSQYDQKIVQGNSETTAADIAKMLFSLDTVISSIATLAKQQSLASSITPLGFNTASSFIATVKHEGKAPLFSQKLNSLITRLSNQSFRHTHHTWEGLGPKFSHLSRLIEMANAQNIKLTLFINPYHISYLHLLQDLGYWPDFILWKTHLAQFLQAQPSPSFTAWDFSGINEITAEPINLDAPHQEMAWFWEPAHYKASLGELMLPILLSESSNQRWPLNLMSTQTDAIFAEDTVTLKQSDTHWQALKKRLNLAL